MKKLFDFLKAKRQIKKEKIKRAKALLFYMETMTLPEQRLLRQRNANSWHKVKPRMTEFQKLVNDYMQTP